MIKIDDKRLCSGCGACSQICPKSCIKMQEDSEGFLYPIVENEECIECGLCKKVCPIINKQTRNGCINSYVAQNRDDNILKESTSGGFFSALASVIINKGGFVFGAAYDDFFCIHHVSINEKKELSIFRNSKYCQSKIGNSFLECKKMLDDGKWVCFSGTPCQIEGLKAFLKVDYEKLITVDFVCRGVPSPKLFRKYLGEYGKFGNIVDVKFREKYYGYNFSTMAVTYDSGRVKRNDINQDPMLKFFFNELCSRPICHQCPYKTMDRVSDFTLFDCWHVRKFSPEMDNNKGATAVVFRTKKAQSLLEEISTQCDISTADIELLVELDGKMMIESVPENPKRYQFFDDLDGMCLKELLNKYLKDSFKKKITNRIKPFLFRIGLFDVYMNMKK